MGEASPTHFRHLEDLALAPKLNRLGTETDRPAILIVVRSSDVARCSGPLQPYLRRIASPAKRVPLAFAVAGSRVCCST